MLSLYRSIIQSMERLIAHYRNLLKETDVTFQRYLYDQIEWDNRMIAILGPRGIGKTTLLLQYIKLNLPVSDTLYVTADDFYFSENRLFDMADLFYKNGGKYLFIDEIHKYSDWSKELKLIYDYFPSMKIVFTGSSVLDLYRGSDDLSRRVVMYEMQGLSFREYLNMFHKATNHVYPLADILLNKIDLPEIKNLLPLFKEYLKVGYYPFSKEKSYLSKLQNVINLTLETDIPFYAKMNISTARKIKQLLYIITQSSPFKPNFVEIAKMIQTSRNSMSDYLYYMEKAGVIAQLRDHAGGLRNLGKVEKVYLDNTNLIYALGDENPNIGNVRETFFFNQMRVNNVITSSPQSDFLIEGITFEVGGANKKKKQIAGLEKAYIVKDDIEYGFGNTLPLWAFGFNY